MRFSLARVASTIVVDLLFVACASATVPTTSPTPAPSVPSPAAPAAGSPTPVPTGTAMASPAVPASPASANLRIRGSAREVGERVLMAPGPDGTLYVSIPRPDGAVLALLDRNGQPLPGWPITIKDSTSCGRPLPVDDGSVRISCDGTDLPQFDNDPSDMRVFAFDKGGRLMAGWPVQLRPGTGFVVGDELTILALQWLTDTVTIGRVSHEAWVTTVAADGAIRRGTTVPIVEACCGEQWDVGPDGVGYGVLPVGERFEPGSAETSQLIAIDLAGKQAGWPVSFDGIASGPAFGPGGRIVVTVGSHVRRTSRVLAFDRDGAAVAASSAELPIATGEHFEVGDISECALASPRPPLVASDGKIFVFSEIDTAVYGLDPSLEVRRGWPFQPAAPLENTSDPRDEIGCHSLARPGVGPDSSLYLPLESRDASIGGSIVAVDPDGRVRPGWPVELKRPGAEFWSVVVGSDGTVYALAIEPEAGDASSATILAIAPDSAVRFITTIIEP